MQPPQISAAGGGGGVEVGAGYIGMENFSVVHEVRHPFSCGEMKHLDVSSGIVGRSSSVCFADEVG